MIAKGENKVSFHVDQGLQVEMRLLPEASYGAALQYFTGSKAHNVTLRQRALKLGYTLNEWALARLDDGSTVAAATEKEIYSALAMDWMPPDKAHVSTAKAIATQPTGDRRRLIAAGAGSIGAIARTGRCAGAEVSAAVCIGGDFAGVPLIGRDARGVPLIGRDPRGVPHVGRDLRRAPGTGRYLGGLRHFRRVDVGRIGVRRIGGPRFAPRLGLRRIVSGLPRDGRPGDRQGRWRPLRLGLARRNS